MSLGVMIQDFYYSRPLEVFDGVMLNGGAITYTTPFVLNPVFRFYMARREHIDWFVSVRVSMEQLGFEFKEPQPRQRLPYAKERARETWSPVGMMLVSRANEVAARYYRRWYESVWKKRLPFDFFLTPISLAQLFMGNGSISRRGKVIGFMSAGIRAVSAADVVHITVSRLSPGDVDTLSGQMKDIGMYNVVRRYGPRVHVDVERVEDVQLLLSTIRYYLAPSFTY